MTELHDGGATESAASLAAAVLEEEARRQAAQDAAREQVIFPDDLLPGVNSEPITLREGLKTGGPAMFIVLTLISALDELEGAAMSLLAPEMRRSLNVSEGTIVFIATASAAFFVLGAVPMGWLADRVKRTPLVGMSALSFGGFVFLSGLAPNAFALFWTRLASGLSKASTITVHGSLLADNYPIGVRARMAAAGNMAAHGLVGQASPILVAVIANAAGGPDGWRWAWLILGLPVAVCAFAAFSLKEPPRGQFEKFEVIGEVNEDAEPMPISMESAFARLKKIRTIRSVLVAFCALGFGLFSVGPLTNLYVEKKFDLSLMERGILGSLIGIAALPLLPFVGRYFDRVYRKDPAKALALVGAMIIPSAIFTPLQFSTDSIIWFAIFGIPQSVLTTSAFAMVGPVMQAVCPYKLRGMGASLSTMYIFLIGGFGGGIVANFLTDAIGTRGTVIALGLPTSVTGGLLLMNGARFIRNDLSLVVEELLEEQEEFTKRNESGAATPVIQVANVDYSYGSVQVLFDVNFEVRRGETLALLGTNGAGKSTILRCISGLGVPDRGVVRLNGRDMTYVAPEARCKLGVMQLPGGKGVFPALTVRQNLAVSARMLENDTDQQQSKIEEVLQIFPELSERDAQTAGSLSGGQQQMLALARVLMHDPEVLLIDELSLGLAPVVVQRLLEIIELLKTRGQTMVIVEQSLNVALAISDRAIFLEKGEVRFEGDAKELAARDDLARAVFFGADGG